MALLLAPRVLSSQERGAIALGEAVLGLGVNTRVLMIGAHPDDEDSFLIAWLSRGRHVETAYLSLTRGDGGQNIIGNELGDALGVLRTEELLAARRIDGAKQFFTRAYDFGFSKDTVDTYKHWPRDSILGDVVRIVRAFRPHVIVAVFSGTPRDGHGHHQVSGLLARAAYDVANDTKRFPVAVYGAAWTPLKFYRAARFNPDAGTLRFDVGENSPLLERSYVEIASESRSQHKSQGFGAIRRSGPVYDFVRLEASRVNDVESTETSLFDGIDTTWARFRSRVPNGARRVAIDSLPAAIAAVQSAYRAGPAPGLLLPLTRVDELLADVESDTGVDDADLEAALATTRGRAGEAMQVAAGLDVKAYTLRELAPVGRRTHVTLSIANRGADTAIVDAVYAGPERISRIDGRRVPPGSVLTDTIQMLIDSISQPWWLVTPRVGSMFTQPASGESEDEHGRAPAVNIFGNAAKMSFVIGAAVTYRSPDSTRSEIRRHVAGAPAISLTLDQPNQYVVANTNIDREFSVHLRSADDRPRIARVRLTLPRGLTADNATRTVRLARYDDQKTLTFRIRGRLPSGEHAIAAVAESNGERFNVGYDVIDYEHIRPQRLYRTAATTLSAVDIVVPKNLRALYIAGVGDNVAPTLKQLGIPVMLISAGDVARADLNSYTTVVVGPRAYEAHPELIAANQRLFDFARNGGTLVVQYGQNEMTQPGALPYPITLSRPADRVTEEDAPVAIDAPNARELATPNRIGQRDFANWVQERTVYMPRTFDEHYRSLISMNDSGEPPNRGAILFAPMGKGVYVYSTLSFFRQLPAGNPGAARLFVNLLSAGLTPGVVP